MHESSSCGLLHSEICGSKLAYSSPQLIAVNHVLHRLPMPRHSPCAFVCFTFRALCSPCVNYEFFWLLVVYPNQNLHFDVVFAFRILLRNRSFPHFRITLAIQFSRYSFCPSQNRFQKKISLLLKSVLSSLEWAQVDSNHRPHAYQACALTG